MSGVVRIFRIDYRGAQRHVVERDGVWRLVDGDVFGSFTHGAVIPSEGWRLLPPVDPTKIIAVGLNYKDHIAEVRKPQPAEPLIFMKPSTAVIGPGDAVIVPHGVGRVDYEAEMAVVIGRRARCVAAARARDYVYGVTCLNDVTARELQVKDVQYTRAKGFDTFAPLGPCVAVGLDDSALDVETWVNGTRRQASNTRELIFRVETLVAFVSSVMTLLPGDVISTGTPSGIGQLLPGDEVTVRVEGVGEMTNPVLSDEARAQDS